MTVAPIVVFGSGGHAREVARLAQECGRPVVAHVDDDHTRHGTHVNGIPVLSLGHAFQEHPDAEYVVAVGDPALRERLAERIANGGGRFTTLIHPSVGLSSTVSVGSGSVVMEGSILTVDITIGGHVQVNVGCSISHDCVLEDHATLAPGVRLSGAVRVERGANIGTGAVVINGKPGDPIVIGSNAVVGAAACVIRSVRPGSTVVGVPARETD